MNFGTVQIDTHNSPLLRDWKIHLEGVDVSKHVRRITVDAEAGMIANIRIEFVGAVHIPASLIGNVNVTVVSDNMTESHE